MQFVLIFVWLESGRIEYALRLKLPIEYLINYNCSLPVCVQYTYVSPPHSIINSIRDCITRLIYWERDAHVMSTIFFCDRWLIASKLNSLKCFRKEPAPTTTKLMSKCIHVHTKISNRNCNHHVIKITREKKSGGHRMIGGYQRQPSRTNDWQKEREKQQMPSKWNLKREARSFANAGKKRMCVVMRACVHAMCVTM